MSIRDRDRLAMLVVVGCLSTWAYVRGERIADHSNAQQRPGVADVPQDRDSQRANVVLGRNGETSKQASGLDHLLEVSDLISTGAEPQGDRGFASLVRLGVKTVVSVDGARPDVAMARKHGLRYVHIPMGYDGIGSQVGLSLTRLVREADGRLYIHCHHGRHRGPAAAAVAAIASGAIEVTDAVNILRHAGTSTRYAGLWRDVKKFQSPVASVELPALVEVAEVGSLPAAMAQIDRVHDDLERCRDSRWAPPVDHPDGDAAESALLLKELLRESARNLPGPVDDELRASLGEAESIAQSLEHGLRTNVAIEELSRRFRRLETSCNGCHEKHRNGSSSRR